MTLVQHEGLRELTNSTCKCWDVKEGTINWQYAFESPCSCFILNSEITCKALPLNGELCVDQHYAACARVFVSK